MEHELDVRGLRCPVPLLRARAAWPRVAAGEALVVRATDPEAPIDLAAFAADVDAACEVAATDGTWRVTLRHRAARTSAEGAGAGAVVPAPRGG